MATEAQLHEQIEESIKLTRQMLDAKDGLEARLDKIEAGFKDFEGKSAPEIKAEINKMAEANAEAIDEIKALTEELRTEKFEALKAELTERLDQFETKHPAGTKAGGDGANVDFAVPVFKALSEYEDANIPELIKASKGRDKKVQRMLSRPGGLTIEVPGAKNWLYKTVTSLSASAGDAQIPEYEPQLIRPGEQPITLLDVLPRAMTESPLIYWVVEVLGSRTNNVDIQSLDFTGTDQGTALGESDFVFDQKSAETRTYGHTAKVALQILEDVGQLRGYLENIMRYMVRFDLEDQIINGDNTGKNFNGLKNQATAYDATLDNDLGVTALQNLDVIRLAIHQCALTFFPATATLLHPAEATSLELLKDEDKRYLFVMNPNAAQTIRPWGVPIVSTTSQTQGDFTTGAMNQVEVVIRKAIEVMIATENEDDFDKLLATMRAYGRGGLKVYQPGSIIDGDFTTAKA